jgi:hypothetical protein
MCGDSISAERVSYPARLKMWRVRNSADIAKEISVEIDLHQ